jgi:hypothetical protein
MNDEKRACISIIEAVEECKAGNIDLTEHTQKDRKTGLPVTKYYWDRVGHKGSLYLQVGDMTKPITSWPFLLREPSKHPDQGDEVSALGAFTAIPDPAEREAFLWFREWQLERIFAKKVVKGKKGETLESVRSEVRQLGLVPESEGQNFCFTQKLQPGGSIESLRTNASVVYKSVVKDPVTGLSETVYDEGPDLDMHTLRASANIFTNIELGALQRIGGKWNAGLMYVRKLVCVTAKEEQVTDTTFRIGGVVVRRRDATPAQSVPTVSSSLGLGSGEEGDVTTTNEASASVSTPSPSSTLTSASAGWLPDSNANTGTGMAPTDRKTFGEAVAEDIARLSAPAAGLLKRASSVLASIPVPLLGEDVLGATGAATGAAPPVAKRSRITPSQ